MGKKREGRHTKQETEKGGGRQKKHVVPNTTFSVTVGKRELAPPAERRRVSYSSTLRNARERHYRENPACFALDNHR